ncbi:hypothetical protein CBS147332_5783 [Penicillium roqueforti]|nr:hypothetical protein CBS147332_5783 [Penicillium roqueforti]KAI3111861.1 hypothetical protein CBS147331_4415 [Penicillium roqueforti]
MPVLHYIVQMVKRRQCQKDLDDCETKRGKCQNDLLQCRTDKSEVEDNEKECLKKLKELQDELDKKGDGSGWGKTDGKIKCDSGSLTTADLDGRKWLTLCGFIINDVKKGERGVSFEECVAKCSQEDNCKAITYDKKRGDCYRARKFKTGDMRYSDYYDTVLRLT